MHVLGIAANKHTKSTYSPTARYGAVRIVYVRPEQVRLRHHLRPAILRRDVHQRDKHVDAVREVVCLVVEVRAIAVPRLRLRPGQRQHHPAVPQHAVLPENGADEREPRGALPQVVKRLALKIPNNGAAFLLTL